MEKLIKKLNDANSMVKVIDRRPRDAEGNRIDSYLIMAHDHDHTCFSNYFNMEDSPILDAVMKEAMISYGISDTVSFINNAKRSVYASHPDMTIMDYLNGSKAEALMVIDDYRLEKIAAIWDDLTERSKLLPKLFQDYYGDQTITFRVSDSVYHVIFFSKNAVEWFAENALPTIIRESISNGELFNLGVVITEIEGMLDEFNPLSICLTKIKGGYTYEQKNHKTLIKMVGEVNSTLKGRIDRMYQMYCEDEDAIAMSDIPMRYNPDIRTMLDAALLGSYRIKMMDTLSSLLNSLTNTHPDVFGLDADDLNEIIDDLSNIEEGIVDHIDTVCELANELDYYTDDDGYATFMHYFHYTCDDLYGAILAAIDATAKASVEVPEIQIPDVDLPEKEDDDEDEED